MARLLAFALLPLAASAGDGPMNVLGRADAAVLVVEYTDLECPYCATYERETFPEIRRLYVDTGKVRYVAMDFPLPMHEHSLDAAIAAAAQASRTVSGTTGPPCSRTSRASRSPRSSTMSRGRSGWT